MPVRQHRRGPIVVFVALVIVTTGIVVSGFRADAMMGRTVIAGAAIVAMAPVPGVRLDDSPGDTQELQAEKKRQVVPPSRRSGQQPEASRSPRPAAVGPTKPQAKSAPSGADRAEARADVRVQRAAARAESKDARAQAKQQRAQARATVKNLRSELREQAKAVRAESRNQAKRARAEAREVRGVVHDHLHGHLGVRAGSARH